MPRVGLVTPVPPRLELDRLVSSKIAVNDRYRDLVAQRRLCTGKSGLDLAVLGTTVR